MVCWMGISVVTDGMVSCEGSPKKDTFEEKLSVQMMSFDDIFS